MRFLKILDGYPDVIDCRIIGEAQSRDVTFRLLHKNTQFLGVPKD
jgi:hypothetical protein